MDLLEDPVFKTKYQKCKIRVKLWESDFMEKYGRKPNKNDIKEANISIREAYKMYWKLKTQALEETLMDITFSDDVQANVSVNSLPKPTIEKVEEEKVEKKLPVEFTPEKKDAENIDPHPRDSLSQIEKPIPDCKNIKGVWGEHLSKSNEEIPKKRQSLLIGKSSSFQLSQNKFASVTFAKRNPRKSLSSLKSKSKSDKDVCAGAPLTVDEATSNSKDDFDIMEETKAIFGEPLKVVQMDSKPAAHSINTVQQLIEGHIPNINRNLNQGWLERCSKESNIEVVSYASSQRLSGMSDSGVESMESSIYSPKESAVAVEPSKCTPMSDEEDFIFNSDSEEERRNKRVRNFKKRLSDQDSHLSKRPCIETASSTATGRSLQNQNNLSINNVKPDNNRLEINTQPSAKSEIVTKSAVSLNSHTASNEVKANNVDSNVSIVDDIKGKPNGQIKDISADKTAISVDKHTAETEKPRPRRKVHRRVKQVLSDDDSDADNVNEEDANATVENSTHAKRAAKRTKNIRKVKDNTDNKKPVTKPERRRRSKKVDTDVKADVDSEVESLTVPQIPTYGVETLNVVPRFAFQNSGTGNLIVDFSKTVSLTNPDAGEESVAAKPKGKLTDKEKLEQKVAAGRVNENYVRINLKKKVFVRGKKSFNFSKYKKNQWKQRKKELTSSEANLDMADLMDKNGGMACFKCGETGHFSRYCPAMKPDALLPLNEMTDLSPYPTLEEAEAMASHTALVAHANRIDRLPEKASRLPSADVSQSAQDEDEHASELLDGADFSEAFDDNPIPQGHEIPEELLSRLLPPESSEIQPLYPLRNDQSIIDAPAEVHETLRMFGHESFRPGQEKAIMRILSGQSTLVTLSTGSGKSLCYQLPAYLYSRHSHCITLVISPLVSLMDDQVTGVPSFLSAACLHTGQAPKVRNGVMEMVKQGKVNILLVSPEAVVAGEKSTGFGALLRQLPPIAFACIDEAHCISQWSHNFRPSYLMICRVLREKLRVKTVLGLTATATSATANSIVEHLGIHDGTEGIISDIPMPSNLLLTVSMDEHRDHALVSLLRSERFQDCDSVIIYCTRREECARVAALLRVSLQDALPTEKPNVKVSSIAEAYHAGLTAHRRKVVQKAFMSGQTRIVVATVAFGMGINKPDIRSVIHYNMPGSFEGYVQEVGRAGRDGLRAQCHLFLHPSQNSDKWELRRHIYANGVDRHVIRRLLQKVFVPCSCTNSRERVAGKRCPGHEVAIPVAETVKALDVSEEIIATLLCYLELHPKRFITVLSSVYVKATVSSYNGPQALKLAAQSSPPLAMAIALDLKKGISHEDSTIIEFPVIDIASAIGWDSGVVKSHLKNLEWKTVNGQLKRSAISVRYDTLGLRVKAPGDLTDVELDEALDALYARTQSQESASVMQLEAIDTALHKFSMPTIKQCLVLNDEIIQKSDELKDTIRSYFKSNMSLQVDCKLPTELSNEAEIAGDVRNLILSYRDNNFTGRAVARIFHGIQSPNYPAVVWGRCRFWRAHLSVDFNAICQIATREILALR